MFVFIYEYSNYTLTAFFIYFCVFILSFDLSFDFWTNVPSADTFDHAIVHLVRSWEFDFFLLTFGVWNFSSMQLFFYSVAIIKRNYPIWKYFVLRVTSHSVFFTIFHHFLHCPECLVFTHPKLLLSELSSNRYWFILMKFNIEIMFDF